MKFVMANCHPMENTEVAIAWFIACLRLGMRDKYQASNSDLASCLNEFARDRGVYQEPPINGAILKHWGSPEKLRLKAMEPWQLKACYQFYLLRELTPAEQKGWIGLITVHQKVTGELASALPPYLHRAGLHQWLSRIHQPLGREVT